MTRFVFRIKTAGGSIIGNVLIEARDQYEAENKLYRRYPDCQILGCDVE